LFQRKERMMINEERCMEKEENCWQLFSICPHGPLY
jgi:hypothetical protein